MNGGLEIIPVPVVILDRLRRIVSCNRIAHTLLGETSTTPLEGRHFGDVLRCVNALAQPRGCGESEFCPECVFHQVIQEVRRTGIARKREVRLTAQSDSGPVERVVLVSARALSHGAATTTTATVLVVEDVSDLRRLRGLVPICAQCKKIRADDQVWHHLESFIEAHSLALFTHSLCPDCEAEFYREIGRPTPPSTC